MFLLTILIISISLLFLIIASYFDLKTGEIPERLSRGFIFSIGFISFLISFYLWNFSILLFTFFLGFCYFLFGYLTFYFGQWGGGDVKILTAIGLSLGLLGSLNFNFQNSNLFPYYIFYFINMGIVALPYAFLFGVILALKDKEKKVFQEFFSEFRKNKKFLLAFFLSFFPILLSIYLNLFSIAIVYLSLPFFVLISLYLKILEKVALIKEISVFSLREGDIVAEDFFVGGKKISSKDINGLSKDEILEIQSLAEKKKISENIKIKFGIKFVPILMLSFLFTIIFGNFLELIFKFLLF